MDPKSIPLTSFIKQKNSYEFLYMPFGAMTASQTFQRVISEEAQPGGVSFTWLAMDTLLPLVVHSQAKAVRCTRTAPKGLRRRKRMVTR